MGKSIKRQSWRSAQFKVLVIDDLADREFDADILLDQNYFGEKIKNRYVKLVNNDCLCLLGPSYALLGDEYSS